MNPPGRYPVLSSLLRPFRRSQQKTCAAIVAALCQAAQASSFAIAGQPSCLSGVQLGSALNRLYRSLRNDRFDDWSLTEQVLRLLGRGPGPPLLAPDWTCWQDRFSLLTASVCAGTRALPAAAAACTARNLSRSQNLFEETFLRLCVDRLRAATVSAVWLCDRGSHRVGWLKLMVECGQHFVVRLKRDVTVRLPSGSCLLKSLQVAEGERRDFGFVELRRDGAVRVRLIGVWAKGAKEVWWLATDPENAVSKVVSYYDRRVGIEEQSRDAKGVRFGLKLKWTRLTRPEFVGRMYLLVGVALLLWTSVGRAMEEAEPKVRLESRTKGARLSLARVGSYYRRELSTRLRLTAQFVRGHLPPPRLRMFKWLMAPQK
ncbi:MAG TPA: hypothetical protein VF591_21570 [Pyrinomonadaceae bacterium]|jgi:hypothetical protein